MLLIRLYFGFSVIDDADSCCVLIRPNFPHHSSLSGGHDEVPTPDPIFTLCLLRQQKKSGHSGAGVTGLTSENFSGVFHRYLYAAAMMRRLSNFSPFFATTHNCLASLFATAIIATFFGFLAKIKETQSDLCLHLQIE